MRILAGAAVALILSSALVLVGCGDDDDSDSAPTPTITPQMATPTPTPEEEEPGHVEAMIGSHHAGGGELHAHYEFEPPIPLPFSECLGGSGANCEGGTALYLAGNPGLDSTEEDMPEESLYTLTDGTAVRFTIVSIAPQLSMRLEGVTLDSAGDSVVLGEVPFHADAETVLALPGGEPPTTEFAVTYTLSAQGYETSAEHTLTFVAAAAEE